MESDILKTRRKIYKYVTKTFGTKTFDASTVKRIFNIYDKEFFNGQIKERVEELASKKGKFTVNPKIEFKATKRLSGYGSTSGFYFNKIAKYRGGGVDGYKYEKVFFFDISPSLFSAIFPQPKSTLSLPCNDFLSCLMMIIEHEIIHLLMSLWGFDLREKENPVLFGPHGSLFNCMLKKCFGFVPEKHNLSMEGIPTSLGDGGGIVERKEIGAGFSNWAASCYLDSVIMIMMETKSDFWREAIFSTFAPAIKNSINPDLAEEVREALIEDYNEVHEGGVAIECRNVRELLSIQDPLMKSSRGGWKMYESGSTYATFVQLFPALLLDVPVRIVRPSLKVAESMTYRTEGVFTFSDFMLSPAPLEADPSSPDQEDYKEILWDSIQSPVLVFTHQGAPKITVFDSTGSDDDDDAEAEDGEEPLIKIRAFGPFIINNKYRLSGVITIHGVITSEGGGGHYTSYFLAKDNKWYYYDDMGPVLDLVGDEGHVAELPREGVWEQTGSEMPTMYFYTKITGLSEPEPLLPEKKKTINLDNFDYTRTDRPDGGVIFVVRFKANEGSSEKNTKLIQAIRKYVNKMSPVSADILNKNQNAVPAETLMNKEPLQILWRVLSKKQGDGLEKILRQSQRKVTFGKAYIKKFRKSKEITP